MSETRVEQLRGAAERLQSAVDRQTAENEEVLERLERAAEDVAAAWSGSSLGYHAIVYYEGLKPPPPGAHFSSEWGLNISFAPGTSGAWREYRFEEVENAIRNAAGDPDLGQLKRTSQEVAKLFRDEQSRFESLLSSASVGVPDPYLVDLRAKAADLRVISYRDCIRAQLPSGELRSRDAVAISSGLKHAPHQAVLAEVVSLRMPFLQSRELLRLCVLAADHLQLAIAEGQPRTVASGMKVFIGHGRSLEWLKLKDFLQDQLGLEWDEFNRVPVAGVTNVARLGAMLDGAVVAFLVMTAEDEQVDGQLRARENVVHEAGLFQGRLGFTKAIVMLEETCAPFSNIEGLGQLRFPVGRIETVFEEVRRVLKRENIH